jgi:hypothetical protein
LAINFTFLATEAPAVVYLEDGSSTSFPPQEEEHFQLPSGGICTFSSTAGSEEGDEHMSPEERAVVFAERMIAMWVAIADKAREAALGPTATPV